MPSGALLEQNLELGQRLKAPVEQLLLAEAPVALLQELQAEVRPQHTLCPLQLGLLILLLAVPPGQKRLR